MNVGLIDVFCDVCVCAAPKHLAKSYVRLDFEKKYYGTSITSTNVNTPPQPAHAISPTLHRPPILYVLQVFPP